MAAKVLSDIVVGTMGQFVYSPGNETFPPILGCVQEQQTGEQHWRGGWGCCNRT